jgi:hypothetical protein
VSKRLIRVKKSQGSRQNNFEKKKKKKQFRNFIFADDDVDWEISNPLSYLVSFFLSFFYVNITNSDDRHGHEIADGGVFLFFSLPPTRGTRSKHFYIRKKEEEEEGEDTAREKV